MVFSNSFSIRDKPFIVGVETMKIFRLAKVGGIPIRLESNSELQFENKIDNKIKEGVFYK